MVDELVRCGMTPRGHVPGLAQRAAGADPGRRRRGSTAVSVIDERAAGFMALGMAKASGRPVAVTCTSGTAAANLAPAVHEAWQARVPLIVLTADRPPELRDVGAGQAIDQIGMYGSAAKWFVELGNAEPGPVWNAHVRAHRVPRLVHGRGWPARARARQPAAARAAGAGAGGACRGATGRAGPTARPWTVVREHSAGSRRRRRAGAGRPDRRFAPRAWWSAAPAPATWPSRWRGWPPGRAGPSWPIALSGRALRPARPQPRGGPLRRAAARRGASPPPTPRTWCCAWATRPPPSRCGRGSPARNRWWPTPSVRGMTRPGAPTPCWRRDPPPPATRWPRRWRCAAAASTAAGCAPGARPTPWSPPPWPPRPTRSSPRSTRRWRTSCPRARRCGSARRCRCARSSPSSPWPTADPLPGQPGRQRHRRRGGLRRRAPRWPPARPTWVLIGEVALVHDAGGLLAAARAGADITIVCVDNGGGGIFDFLPLPAHADPGLYDEHVATPTGVDPTALAALAGLQDRFTGAHRPRRQRPAAPRALRASGAAPAWPCVADSS